LKAEYAGCTEADPQTDCGYTEADALATGALAVSRSCTTKASPANAGATCTVGAGTTCVSSVGADAATKALNGAADCDYKADQFKTWTPAKTSVAKLVAECGCPQGYAGATCDKVQPRTIDSTTSIFAFDGSAGLVTVGMPTFKLGADIPGTLFLKDNYESPVTEAVTLEVKSMLVINAEGAAVAAADAKVATVTRVSQVPGSYKVNFAVVRSGTYKVTITAVGSSDFKIEKQFKTVAASGVVSAQTTTVSGLDCGADGACQIAAGEVFIASLSCADSGGLPVVPVCSPTDLNAAMVVGNGGQDNTAFTSRGYSGFTAAATPYRPEFYVNGVLLTASGIQTVTVVAAATSATVSKVTTTPCVKFDVGSTGPSGYSQLDAGASFAVNVEATDAFGNVNLKGNDLISGYLFDNSRQEASANIPLSGGASQYFKWDQAEAKYVAQAKVTRSNGFSCTTAKCTMGFYEVKVVLGTDFVSPKTQAFLPSAPLTSKQIIAALDTNDATAQAIRCNMMSVKTTRMQWCKLAQMCVPVSSIGESNTGQLVGSQTIRFQVKPGPTVAAMSEIKMCTVPATTADAPECSTFNGFPQGSLEMVGGTQYKFTAVMRDQYGNRRDPKCDAPAANMPDADKLDCANNYALTRNAPCSKSIALSPAQHDASAVTQGATQVLTWEYLPDAASVTGTVSVAYRDPGADATGNTFNAKLNMASTLHAGDSLLFDVYSTDENGFPATVPVAVSAWSKVDSGADQCPTGGTLSTAPAKVLEELGGTGTGTCTVVAGGAGSCALNAGKDGCVATQGAGETAGTAKATTCTFKLESLACKIFDTATTACGSNDPVPLNGACVTDLINEKSYTGATSTTYDNCHRLMGPGFRKCALSGDCIPVAGVDSQYEVRARFQKSGSVVVSITGKDILWASKRMLIQPSEVSATETTVQVGETILSDLPENNRTVPALTAGQLRVVPKDAFGNVIATDLTDGTLSATLRANGRSASQNIELCQGAPTCVAKAGSTPADCANVDNCDPAKCTFTQTGQGCLKTNTPKAYATAKELSAQAKEGFLDQRACELVTIGGTKTVLQKKDNQFFCVPACVEVTAANGDRGTTGCKAFEPESTSLSLGVVSIALGGAKSFGFVVADEKGGVLMDRVTVDEYKVSAADSSITAAADNNVLVSKDEGELRYTLQESPSTINMRLTLKTAASEGAARAQLKPWPVNQHEKQTVKFLLDRALKVSLTTEAGTSVPVTVAASEANPGFYDLSIATTTVRTRPGRFLLGALFK
jgi:hypothetical protein